MQQVKFRMNLEAPIRFTRWDRTGALTPERPLGKPVVLFRWKFRTSRDGKLSDLSLLQVSAACACRARWEFKKSGVSPQVIEAFVLVVLTPRGWDTKDLREELCRAVFCLCGQTEKGRS